MRHLSRHPHLVEETLQAVLVALELRGQELQCDGLAQLEVVGAEDFTHPALAELPDDAVAAGEHLPRNEAAVGERIPAGHAAHGGVGRGSLECRRRRRAAAARLDGDRRLGRCRVGAGVVPALSAESLVDGHGTRARGAPRRLHVGHDPRSWSREGPDARQRPQGRSLQQHGLCLREADRRRVRATRGSFDTGPPVLGRSLWR